MVDGSSRVYDPDICLVYLSHIYMLPEARGTVLTYWLRIAPIEIAVEYLFQLQQRGLVRLPAPDQPGRYFGLRLDLAAEMEYFSPEDRQSLQRILFYGRGGFDVVDPRHFPYRQPDFRDAAQIRAPGDTPVPFMLLLRRIGRERQARLPLDEASSTLRLLYDEFACLCAPEFLQNSLDVVLERLEQRHDAGKSDVALLPLPTGPENLGRLRRLFRYDVYQRHYPGAPGTEPYLHQMRPRLAENPRWYGEELARISAELAATPRYVYGSRDRRFAVDAMRAAEEGRRPWRSDDGNAANAAEDADGSRQHATGLRRDLRVPSLIDRKTRPEGASGFTPEHDPGGSGPRVFSFRPDATSAVPGR